MTLAQKCIAVIQGQSGFGYLLRQHVCCGIPIAPRGTLPKRCICPPTVSLDQAGYNCETGNKLLCGGRDVGGNILLPLDQPSNMLGANFSMTKDAFRDNPTVRYEVPGLSEVRFQLADIRSKVNQNDFQRHINASVRLLCDFHPNRKSFTFCEGLL